LGGEADIMTHIDIIYPEEKIKQSRDRLNNVYNKQKYLDRIPVQIGLQTGYFLDIRKFGFLEYFSDAKAQVYHQIMNIKWRLENVKEDFLTSELIVLAPDLQNIATSANFNGVEVVWDDKNPPRIKHFINEISELRKLKLPLVTDGICGRKIRMLAEMQEEIKNYTVTLNGNPIPVKITAPGTEGPFTDALDLLGEKLFVWLYEFPDDIKEFMKILASALINFEKYIRNLCDHKRKGISITSDGAEMLSPVMFKEFVLPYNEMIFNEFPEYKEFHMCGKIDHLLDIVSNMNIDHLVAFGFSNDICLMKKLFGSRFVYSGGVNPILLKYGERSEIEKEICRYIKIFGDIGTYILGDGASVAPGTSLKNINMLCETAEQYRFDNMTKKKDKCENGN
jgi:uroporphyrinogen-III decarboxylase